MQMARYKLTNIIIIIIVIIIIMTMTMMMFMMINMAIMQPAMMRTTTMTWIEWKQLIQFDEQ